MTKLAIFVLYTLGFIATYAQENIIIIDDSYNSTMTQKEIEGCQNSIENQQKEIKKLKKELSSALEKLSKLKKNKSDFNQNQKIDYILVKVKRGDTLSKYAKKYYGDKNKYHIIYRANRDKIKKNLKIKVGDTILIPIKKRKRTKENLNNYKSINQNKKIYNKKQDDIKYYANIDEKLKMLDEIVYIDDSSNLQKEIVFIPLDDN